MPDQHQQTNQSFYDRISGAYDFIADSSEHKAREMGQNNLGLQPGARVLEIGFGTGNSLIDLAKSVAPNGKVIGVDISPGMKKVAAEKIAKTDVADQIELHIGDARNLDFPPDSFDAAFMSFTLELFDEGDIPLVLKELLKSLKPGGKIGVVSMATVKTGDKASVLEKTYIWMHQHFPHIVDCQPIDVVTLVADAGFEIEKEIDMEIWSMPVRAAIGVKPA
ncbi:class I SAM-dependent methyltransferase [Blastopirellula retiformator]|uniref:Demethylmenaquinone methyltransferase n=1 Tax=Blastopirellula retiformator TaxID=2527970 RepID=A0A5C5VPV1_9BACT|nr:methyltransferase domain-containing protein [Blastopirellula retiformator]TWT39729.1 Demethylmenaquinone methyltransferase [Blastopirellula retiformator]